MGKSLKLPAATDTGPQQLPRFAFLETPRKATVSSSPGLLQGPKLDFIQR